jgi:hypothetical protein
MLEALRRDLPECARRKASYDSNIEVYCVARRTRKEEAQREERTGRAKRGRHLKRLDGPDVPFTFCVFDAPHKNASPTAAIM